MNDINASKNKDDNKNSVKKGNKNTILKKIIKIGYMTLGVFIVYTILIFIVSSSSDTPRQSDNYSEVTIPSPPSVTDNPSEVITPVLEYDIKEVQDISYLDCKRVTYRITFNQQANQQDVKDFIEGKLLKQLKDDWQDITIWAYRDNDNWSGGRSTLGTYEAGDCMK